MDRGAPVEAMATVRAWLTRALALSTTGPGRSSNRSPATNSPSCTASGFTIPRSFPANIAPGRAFSQIVYGALDADRRSRGARRAPVAGRIAAGQPGRGPGAALSQGPAPGRHGGDHGPAVPS